jgi:hypothetical protein
VWLGRLRSVTNDESNFMHPDAIRLIDALELAPHSEGGYYRETFRASETISRGTGSLRATSTAIYFLLPARTFSALHRVSSDEIWHFYAGDPLDLHLIEPRGVYEVHQLGIDLGAGQEPQRIVPAGVWQAAVPRGDAFSLCGCTVSPGFDFLDFEMPSRAELCTLFPAHTRLIERLTRV